MSQPKNPKGKFKMNTKLEEQLDQRIKEKLQHILRLIEDTVRLELARDQAIKRIYQGQPEEIKKRSKF